MYCGRFAPSPTGPLHFGSLVAAVASYADARHHAGRWLVRIEDLDSPRCSPAASESILRTLDRFHLRADGEILYQSQRLPLYQAALESLRARGLVYPCACSRKEIADSLSGPRPDGELRYPGHCRHGLPEGRPARGWRLHVPPGETTFHDRLLGPQSQNIDATIGDFILLRADGIFSYQLAVVVDDAAQSVTDVVRGEDLLSSTPRQLLLQRLLGLPEPRYLHFPVVRASCGDKLSKQTGATSIENEQPLAVLRAAAAFLQFDPPAHYDAAALLAWLSEKGPFSR